MSGLIPDALSSFLIFVLYFSASRLNLSLTERCLQDCLFCLKRLHKAHLFSKHDTVFVSPLHRASKQTCKQKKYVMSYRDEDCDTTETTSDGNGFNSTVKGFKLHRSITAAPCVGTK